MSLLPRHHHLYLRSLGRRRLKERSRHGCSGDEGRTELSKFPKTTLQYGCFSKLWTSQKSTKAAAIAPNVPQCSVDKDLVVVSNIFLFVFIPIKEISEIIFSWGRKAYPDDDLDEGQKDFLAVSQLFEKDQLPPDLQENRFGTRNTPLESCGAVSRTNIQNLW